MRKQGKELIREKTGKDPDLFLSESAEAGKSAREIARMLDNQISHVTISRYLSNLGLKPAGWVKPAA